MDNPDDAANWREKGVGNWARDCGFFMTKNDGLYDLWSSNASTRILGGVVLDEIEGYLGSL